MELMFVKLKTGEELVTYITEDTIDTIKLQAPLLIELNPERGFMAKEWLYLSSDDFVTLHKSNVMFTSGASKRAISYYQQFITRFSSKHETEEDDRRSPFDDPDINELEDLFTALMESKSSIKH